MPRRADRRHGRHRSVRDREHLVAGADAEGPEGEEDGVGAGVDADPERDAAKGGELGFEAPHLLAEDESPGVQDPPDGREQPPPVAGDEPPDVPVGDGRIAPPESEGGVRGDMR